MTIIDISMPIHVDMPVYKNREEKRPSIQVLRDFSSGSVYESRLSIEMHTGTHIDAPLHMIDGGEDLTVYPIDKFVSPCKVLDLTHVDKAITKDDLINRDIVSGEFILFKTKNSWDEEFNAKFIYLDKSGAEYLVEKGVIGAGIDSLGIERNQPNHETHKTLLGNKIMILEGLRLRHVEEGPYVLIAAPLNILGVEASPVRAFLMERNSLII
ncbi:MAG: cyclase family protein [Caldicoprobacterales bacterium]|nr:cyclase family protein [Clostridiales bacterium]